MIRRTWIVARRDLGAFFGGPLAWMLGAIFVGLTGYFFYSELALFVLAGGANLAAGLWPHVFLDIRLVMVLVLPLLTMRLVAEERKLGTFELLCTLPVRDHEILAGKYLAVVTVFLAMLVPTTIGPLALYLWHPFPIGPLIAGYLGLVLLGLAVLACGLAASTTSENQIVAAMLTYGMLIFLWYVGWNEAALSWRVTDLVRGFSLFDHFYNFARGVIDVRSLTYFAGFVCFFLFLALRSLGSRAWRGLP
jgi:ABC-2 type transport system permease protein